MQVVSTTYKWVSEESRAAYEEAMRQLKDHDDWWQQKIEAAAKPATAIEAIDVRHKVQGLQQEWQASRKPLVELAVELKTRFQMPAMLLRGTD